MRVEFANLQLEGYYVEHVHCSARRVNEDRPNVALIPGLHVQSLETVADFPYNVILSVEVGQHTKDASRFLVALTVESDEEEENKSPYLFDVTLVGYFRSQVESSDTLRPFLTTNAAMILYSSARELLASITGRGPFPALVLPTLRFDTEREAKLLRRAPVKPTTKRRTTKTATRKPRKLSKKR